MTVQLRPGHAAHCERGHVQRFHWKVHLRVHLRAIRIAPPKSFNVKAQHVRQPVYPEPLGGPLFSHAVVAEVEFAIGQLLDLKESRETVRQTANLLLVLGRPSLQSVWYIQREILEGLVRLRVRAAIHAMDHAKKSASKDRGDDALLASQTERLVP